ncbi:MAG TPA: glycoside hydrolase family 88 protein [Anaerolineae bacterium]|nr:glycoside hydrolase family 88 protein [Anaerolineae bacterium]
MQNKVFAHPSLLPEFDWLESRQISIVRAVIILFVSLAGVLLLTLALVRVPANLSRSPRLADLLSATIATGASSEAGLTATVYAPLILNDYCSDLGVRLTDDPANDVQPALSPDGQRVVFVSDRAGLPDLFSIPISGGQPINLTQTPTASEDVPVFSPDGSTIAFASNRTGDWDIYLMDPNGANLRRAAGYTGTDELYPAFAPDGIRLIFSSNRAAGNWDIYRTALDGYSWIRLTTDPAVDRFPTISDDGTVIAFRSERDGNSEIYLMDADASHTLRVTVDPAYDGYPVIVPDGSGLVFTKSSAEAAAIFTINPSGTGLSALAQCIGWQTDTPRVAPNRDVLLYAARPNAGKFDIYLRPYDSPLALIGKRSAPEVQSRCDWEAGTLGYGWIQAWRATGAIQYLRLAQTWIDSCIAVKTDITHVNDGLLGYTALAVYQEYGGIQRLTFAQKVAGYMLNIAQRTADGALAHEPHTVWDDTLLGAIPFLVKMNEVSGDPVYLEEAITQTIKHANHLQDPLSGLYRHAWDERQSGVWGSVHWGRGNGWVLLADVDLLANISVTHPLRSTVLSIMQKQASGLVGLQDANGLWHTVVTRPSSYLETSGSALIGYAFKRGAQAGWLDMNLYSGAARAAALGVWRKTLADGAVTDVSAPTGPMLNESDYDAVPHSVIQLYGQGVALLLESPSGRSARSQECTRQLNDSPD